MTRDFVYVRELGEHVGETVTLKGWLSQKRSSGKVKFLVLRDCTGWLQCVGCAEWCKHGSECLGPAPQPSPTKSEP